MKSLLALATSCNTLFFSLFAQDVVSIDYLMESPIKHVDIYRTDNLDTTTVLVPFDFSMSDSEVEKYLDSLLSRTAPIEKIDFVYTKFKVSEDFDQVNLNRERLEFLRERAPAIFDNNVIEWEFYEQVNNLNLEANRSLFHGFAIHYLKDHFYSGNEGIPTEEEIDIISDYLGDVYPSRTDSSPGRIHKLGGKYLPILKKKREKGIRYDRKFIFWRKREPVTYDTTWTHHTIPGRYRPIINDTVVTRTLRNYEDDWECVMVIEDVTGSMYPYIAQTLAWKKLKLKTTKLAHFVFFNDGDRRPDGPIGKSGGAYYIHSQNADEIEKKVYDVMRKGGGGGAPENNVEATIYGEKTYDGSPSYILIADNNAPVRDLKIKDDINKAAHIILCGVRNGRIHHSYITLAMSTGGTLHTIEEDIDKVATLKSGDVFEMGGQKFKFLSEGHIVLVR